MPPLPAEELTCYGKGGQRAGPEPAPDLARARAQPAPKAEDETAGGAEDASERTCDEEPKKRPLIGVRREDHRPKKSAAEPDRPEQRPTR